MLPPPIQQALGVNSPVTGISNLFIYVAKNQPSNLTGNKRNDKKEKLNLCKFKLLGRQRRPAKTLNGIKQTDTGENKQARIESENKQLQPWNCQTTQKVSYSLSHQVRIMQTQPMRGSWGKHRSCLKKSTCLAPRIRCQEHRVAVISTKALLGLPCSVLDSPRAQLGPRTEQASKRGLLNERKCLPGTILFYFKKRF